MKRSLRISMMALAICAVGAMKANANPDGHNTRTVAIPAGWFVMGNDQEPPEDSQDDISDEMPKHRVYVDAYEIDRYEVTIREYLTCLRARACNGDGTERDLKRADPDLPIENVSWQEAVQYCNWVGMRLPTEAEWEKASRGPADYLSPWGNRPFKSGDAAIATNIAKVGSFANDKSGYGVYDTAGNVQEWVADWYGAYPNADQYNPKGPKKSERIGREGPERVIRGGAFVTNLKYDWRSTAFSTRRSTWPATSRSVYIGFRCAKSAAPSKSSSTSDVKLEP